MTINKLFEILATESSVVSQLPCQKYFRFVPGYFFILLMFSVFLLSAFLDLALIILLLYVDNEFFIGMVFSTIAFNPIIFSVIFNFSHVFGFKKDNSPPAKWYHYICILFTFYFGLFSFNTREIPIKNIFEERMERCIFPIPIFHLPNEFMATLKIYCFFFVITKSIPQLFVVPIILLTYKVNIWTVFTARTSILHNMVLISLTVALLFPVRKTPRHFPSQLSVFFNAIAKFFGAMCASSLCVLIFTETFQTIGFYAFLIQLFRFSLPLWPCSKAIFKFYPTYTCYYIIFYIPLLALLFSLIYIHPFSLKGRLSYYIIHLLYFLSDIFSLYIFTEAQNQIILIMISLVLLIAAFISCFGLINFFCKKICLKICLPEKIISSDITNEKETEVVFFH